MCARSWMSSTLRCILVTCCVLVCSSSQIEMDADQRLWVATSESSVNLWVSQQHECQKLENEDSRNG